MRSAANAPLRCDSRWLWKAQLLRVQQSWEKEMPTIGSNNSTGIDLFYSGPAYAVLRWLASEAKVSCALSPLVEGIK